MTRIGADQVLIALALNDNGLLVTRAARRQRHRIANARAQGVLFDDAESNAIRGNPHGPKPSPPRRGSNGCERTGDPARIRERAVRMRCDRVGRYRPNSGLDLLSLSFLADDPRLCENPAT